MSLEYDALPSWEGIKRIAGIASDAIGDAASAVGRTASTIGHAVAHPVDTVNNASNSFRRFQSEQNALYDQAVRRAQVPAYLQDPTPGAPSNARLVAQHEASVARSYLGQFAPESLPRNMPARISMYKADPTNHSKGGDGIETQAYTMGAPELYANIRSIARAQRLGIPINASPYDLAATTLKEGRPDLGANGVKYNDQIMTYDPTQKADVANHDKLVKAGLAETGDPYTSTLRTPIAMANKQAAARRLGKDWHELWLGTGRSQYGETGKMYAASMPAFNKAARDPRNAALVQFIQGAIADENRAAAAQYHPDIPKPDTSFMAWLTNATK